MAQEYKCNEGTVFDPALQFCTWENNYQCGSTPDTTEGTTEGTTESTTEETTEGTTEGKKNFKKSSNQVRLFYCLSS